MKYAPVGQVNGWTFYEITSHPFTGELEGKALYTFAADDAPMDSRGAPKYGELYGSLDHAMVAAVGERHTGPRGAGGGGVGTAADWFMRMIGAGQLQEAGPDGGRALVQVLDEGVGGPLTAHHVERGLEAKGYVIARQAI